jgi:putative hydrolase of the HAD superfamily
MIPWHDINSVFLDMDGTLLDLYFDNHFWQEHVPLRYAEHHGMSIEAAHAELVPRFREKEGTLDWYCVEYWSRELKLDIIALKHEINHLIAVHDHVADFLEWLRAADKRVVLLTNAHTRTLDLKMQITGIDHAFDALICSHELGFPKEDPRFWKALTDKEQFNRESTLFIDDSLPVLRAAHDYGIQHILAVSKPDSRRPVRRIDEFMAIEGFNEIIPQSGDTGVLQRASD